MMRLRLKYTQLTFLMLAGLAVVTSCTKNLPQSLDTLSNDMLFTQTVYAPTLGRNTLLNNNFSAGSSTQPLTFQIINLHRASNGAAAPELTENYPTVIWKHAYTGLETSLAQIDSERAIANQPLFSIRVHSGEFLMWAGAQSSFVACAPDSGYTFDVAVSNSGGKKYFRNFRLIPQRERAYEPSNYDPVTGIAANSYDTPLSMLNVTGKTSNVSILPQDVHIFFYKNTSDMTAGNSLTFRFYDSNYNVIDPHNFNETNWAKLVHGFNMQLTTESVRYDVAYPIPLITLPTAYTNAAGTQANTVFSYSRINSGGFREQSSITFDWAIYDTGHWEIIMVFAADSPLF
jgi:hypothetical protein